MKYGLTADQKKRLELFDSDELQIAADLCEENGFAGAATYLRSHESRGPR